MKAEHLTQVVIHSNENPKQEELSKKDWRMIELSTEKCVRIKKQYYILLCIIANHAGKTCKYAICQECHKKHMSRQHFSMAPLSDWHKQCHH